MNIQILDSWLREYLDTKATAKQIADSLCLTSVSVERLIKHQEDFIYDIEVTTNRPDLMSVVGLAREAGAVLPHFGYETEFKPPAFNRHPGVPLNGATRLAEAMAKRVGSHDKEDSIASLQNDELIDIQNDPQLVRRIMAVVMEVQVKESPPNIKKRLEAAGIRSLNNLIDVTNYVMREIGHPTHVFDYDRLTTKKLIIRESKKGEEIETLDHKKYALSGGDIVADDGTGNIIDLMGVMGTANSVVRDDTKRILFFLDNNDPIRIRKTSMGLGVRSEAAVLNEKGVDPELAETALLRGIELFKKIANGKAVSDIIDIYPKKPETKYISVSEEKINEVVGITIPLKTSKEILTSLGFSVEISGSNLKAKVPSSRLDDVAMDVDLIEEIARVYGYHRLPGILAPFTTGASFHLEQNVFYWEKRAKDLLKGWGFVEVYTYSLVSADLFEGPLTEAVTILNPLSEDMIYLRKTLVPSLLEAAQSNKNREEFKMFELANVYIKNNRSLPDEVLTLAGVIKKPNISFLESKGYVEQILQDLGITDISFKDSDLGGEAADVYIKNKKIGDIEVLDEAISDFELNFEEILSHVSLKKIYMPISKYPSAVEDIRIAIDPKTSYQKIVDAIQSASDLVVKVGLLDVYQDKKTFRITYHAERNLTAEDLTGARKKVIESLQKKLKAKVV